MEISESQLDMIAWPLSRLGELLDNLAKSSSLLSNPIDLPQPEFDRKEVNIQDVAIWMDVAAANINLEAEIIEADYQDIEKLIHAAGPAILRLPGSWEVDRPQLLALVKGGKKRVKIMTTDLKKRRYKFESIRNLVCRPYEAAYERGLDILLEEAQVPAERLPRARRAILREQLANVRIEAGWLLRQPPGANLWGQIRTAGLIRPLITMFGLYFIQILLSISAWIVIGRGIFMGHYDWGWILAWVILLFSTIPLSVIVSDAQNEISQRAGVLFKQRLLFGTLNLEPEEIRHQGRGQFLGRVMESEAVEMLFLNGGFLSLMSILELFFAVLILAKGVGGILHASLLVIWVLVILLMLYRNFRIANEWTNVYQDMTNDLVENMVGHRTRLAQEHPKRWHGNEDLAIDIYLKQSERFDQMSIQLNSLSVRGWMILGMLGIIFPFITNTATPQEMVVSLGGILYATQALSKLVAGSQSFISLLIAWRQVSPLFKAAERPAEIQSLDYISHSGNFRGYDSFFQEGEQGDANYPLLLARELNFRYNPDSKPVLTDCSMNIRSGERILLEGSSGSGKTTLAALLTGLRSPETGSLLLNGVDRQIMGSQEWRRKVVMAPQFQENYIFSETFAFNLLMGRRWPPQPADLELAEIICRELGLDEVLEKMPSGLQQMLGENGWQLSHGERSRVYIARTLLQQAELTILDETFGALDPQNLKRALQTVLDRAPTLLVIAHP